MRIQPQCCYPGLPGLWYRGLPRSVLVAVVFSWVLCLLLLTTFVWPEWINAWIVRIFWFGALSIWLVSAARNHWNLGRLLGNVDNLSQADFVQAQQEYLLGNWFEAEAILLKLLNRFPRDAEAHLLLISVLKRTERWKPALRRLDHLESLETAGAWHYEIGRERQSIEEKRAAVCKPQNLHTENEIANSQ